MLNCKECNYKCIKEILLMKHMITNNADHICKQCKKNLPSFMELLKHVEKHHCKYQRDTHDKNYANDGFGKLEESNNYKQGDKEKEEDEEKDLGFVFNKLVLREFL